MNHFQNGWCCNGLILDLKEKYEVLKSEKDTLEKQNTSLKGQRDSLLTTTSSGKQQQSNGTSSFAELEERLENYKKSNSNLKMMNATLMEAFEKLKKVSVHIELSEFWLVYIYFGHSWTWTWIHLTRNFTLHY